MTDTRAWDRGRVKIFVGGISAQLLTIGIARFAYTPLLPVMLEETQLSPATGGLLGGAIYAGYLVATLFLSVIRSSEVRWRLYQIGVLLAVLTTFAMAVRESTALWAVSRFLAGASGAAGMLLASEFLLGWLTRRGLSRDLAPHFAGLGLGISLSGLVAALVHGLPWDGQWLVFGGLAVVLAPLCWVLVPRPDPAALGAPKRAHTKHLSQDAAPAWFWLFGLAYLTAGWGYAVGATFYVSILGQNLFWVLLGLACAVGAIAGSAVARRIGTHLTLKGCYTVQILALALLAFPMGQALALLSAALFGATFIVIVSLSLAEAGLRTHDTGRAMARMTLMYGTGQVGGPLVTGWLRTLTGDYMLPVVLAAGLMCVGLVLLHMTRRFN